MQYESYSSRRRDDSGRRPENSRIAAGPYAVTLSHIDVLVLPVLLYVCMSTIICMHVGSAPGMQMYDEFGQRVYWEIERLPHCGLNDIRCGC